MPVLTIYLETKKVVYAIWCFTLDYNSQQPLTIPFPEHLATKACTPLPLHWRLLTKFRR